MIKKFCLVILCAGAIPLISSAQSDQTIIDRLWKQSLNRAQGTPENEWYNEPIVTSYDIHNDDVYASTISSETNVAISQGIAQYIDAYLTRDRQYPDARVWVVRQPWTNNYASGSDLGASITKNFISTKFGPSYLVKIFKPNGEQITPDDPSIPIFDYRAGTLIFQTSMVSIASGATTSTSLRINVFKYVGQYGGVGSPGANLTPVPGDWNEETAYQSNSIVYYQGSSWYTLQSTTGAPPSLTSTVWNIFVSKGDTGLTGPTGLTAVVSIGQTQTVTPSTPAAVSNLVNGNTNTLFFSIPKGDTGETGATGPVFTVLANPVANVSTDETASVSNQLSENNLTNTLTFTVPSGPQGPIGPTGATGSAGAELYYVGEWIETNVYVNSNLVTHVGSTWYSTHDGNVGNIPSVTSTNWQLFVSKGAAGESSQIQIGTVYTVTNEPAAVTNIGTPSEAILDFYIPAGVPGVDGPIGPPGIALSYIGTWTSTVTYSQSNLVTHIGSTWYSTHDGNVSNTPSVISTNWLLFVEQGEAGETPVIVIGTVETVETNAPSTVTNVVEGITNTFNFQLQRGDRGEQGTAATIEIGTVLTVTNAPATVTNSGDSSSVVLNFEIPVGPQGPIGPQGDQGDPGAELRWIGEWNATNEYSISNLVTHLGSTWYSVKNSTNEVPTESPSEYWQLFVSKGEQGETGSIGPTGATFEVLASETITLSAGLSASVSNNISGSTNNLTFYLPRGDRGEPGLGLVYLNDWTATNEYVAENLVTFEGSTWYALQSNTNEFPTNNGSVYWKQFVSRGSAGSTGISAFVEIGGVTTLNAGESATVTNAQSANTNRLFFGLPRGERGLPGAALTYIGDWTATNIYATSNLVTFEGSTWYALQNSTNKSPYSSEYWTLFVSIGEQGFQGFPGLPGSVGPIGPQGVPGAGNVTFAGTWTNTIPYLTNQLVTHSGIVYYAVENSTNIQPPNVSYWRIFVDRGGPGPIGPLGPQGPPGVSNANIRGVWTNNILYFESDVVSHAGSAWFATLTNLNVMPSYTTTVWSILVERGGPGETGAAGETGPQGPPGVAGTIKGAWTNSAEYFINDLVTYLGSTWYALNDSSNSIPSQSSTNWNIWVSKGDIGDVGPRGPVGQRGPAGLGNLVSYGQWVADFEYPASSIVYNAGSSWYNEQPISNSTPALNSLYWFPFALRGDVGPQGPQGPIGTKGDTGAAGIGVTFIGPWNATNEYSTSNLVSYLGSTWYSLQDGNISNAPDFGSTNWQLFVQRGAVGATGTTGPLGPVGPRGPEGGQVYFIGAWNVTNEYLQSNLVSYIGSTWYATQNSTGQAPTTNSTYWEIFVRRGDVGATGATPVIQIGNVATVTNIPASVTNVVSGITNTLNFQIPRGAVGPQGPPGAELYVAGTWTNTEFYSSNSLVFHSGSTWYSLQNSSNQTPNETSQFWQIFVSNESALDLTNYFYVAGGGNLSTNGRQPGMFIQYAGGNEYVHEFSSVNWIFTPDNTNHPVSGLRLIPTNGITLSHQIRLETNVFNGATSVVDVSAITIGTDGSGQGAITGEYVKSVNTFTGALSIVAGNNVTISNFTNQIQISADLIEGPPGAELYFIGAWTATNEYATSNLVQFAGSTWYATLPSTNEIPTNSASQYWQLFVERGEIGPIGPQGPAATIAIGSVTTGVASVTNVGTSTSAIFNFQIPQGEQGLPGIGINYIGAWSATNEYVISNLVTYLGSTWYAIQNNTNEIPEDASTYWKLFVEKGDIGATGPTGASPIIVIGDVTTVETNVSSSVSNVVNGLTNTLSFQIQRGERGEKGDRGDTGDYVRVFAQTNAVVSTNGIASVENNLDGLTNTLIFTIPRGPQGEQGEPGAELRWIGAWTATNEYSISNLVTHLGSTWYATLPSTNQNPTNSASEYWQLFVEKGDTGATGPIGPTGATFSVQAVNTFTVTNAPAAVSNNIVGTTNQLTFYIPQGEQGLPGLGLNYAGAWSATNEYSISNLVTHAGSTWYAELPSTNQNPTNLPSEYWTKFVSQGDVGPIGPTGAVFIVAATGTVTLTAGSAASVSNNIIGTNNNLTFFIPRGDQGVPGLPLTYLGNWTNTTTYSESNLVTHVGSTWYSTHSDNSNKVPSRESTNWLRFVSQGDVGPTGATGQAATIAVGTVTTVTNQNATVTNVGTTGAAVFNFQIPKGDRGAAGAELYLDGAWTATNEYVVSNLVTYLGSTWYAVQNNTNEVPTNNPTYWGLFVSKGDTGATGPTGATPVIAIGSVTTVATNIPSSVSNAVNGLTNTFSFQLQRGEKGDKGDKGDAATIAVGTVVTVTNAPASVTNVGTANDATFNFQIPKGDQGDTGPQGPPGLELRWVGAWSSASNYVVSNLVTYLGSTYYALDASTNEVPTNAPSYWQLFVEKGEVGATGATGLTAVVAIGATVTGATGTLAIVTNAVDANTNTLFFTIPRGDKGEKGDKGDTGDYVRVFAQTNAIVSTNGLAAVSNSIDGLTNTLIFTIPQGERGDQGPQGETGPAGASLFLAGAWTNVVEYAPSSIVFHVGASWYTLQTSSNQTPGVETNWQLFASGAAGAVTGEYVQSINTLTGAVTISAGDNIIITTNDNSLVISGAAGGSTNAAAEWQSVFASANTNAAPYQFIFADSSAADVIITLPDPATASGKVVGVRKQVDSNLVLITVSATNHFVHGVSTVGISRAKNALTLLSDGGTNWVIK
jgi:hypothetical protein